MQPLPGRICHLLERLPVEMGGREIEEIVSTSWAALAAGEDPHARGLGALLIELGKI